MQGALEGPVQQEAQASQASQAPVVSPGRRASLVLLQPPASLAPQASQALLALLARQVSRIYDSASSRTCDSVSTRTFYLHIGIMYVTITEQGNMPLNLPRCHWRKRTDWVHWRYRHSWRHWLYRLHRWGSVNIYRLRFYQK
jgi:hypothetical protein